MLPSDQPIEETPGTEPAENAVDSTPEKSVTSEIADQLNEQIFEMLKDAGGDGLSPEDPEYAAFQEALDQGILTLDNSVILRGAAKAGREKAARLVKESAGLSAMQLLTRGYQQSRRRRGESTVQPGAGTVAPSTPPASGPARQSGSQMWADAYKKP